MKEGWRLLGGEWGPLGSEHHVAPFIISYSYSFPSSQPCTVPSHTLAYLLELGHILSDTRSHHGESRGAASPGHGAPISHTFASSPDEQQAVHLCLSMPQRASGRPGAARFPARGARMVFRERGGG